MIKRMSLFLLLPFSLLFILSCGGSSDNSRVIAKVGIMNGDVIQKVNGYDINSPEKALQIYSMLKNETKISIDVVRNGRPKTYEYEIR